MSGPQPTAGTSQVPLTLTRVCDPSHELLQELQEYDFEAFGATGLRTYDLAVMAQAGAVFAARVGQEIVGGCQIMRVLDDPESFYVVGFYIRPQWQRRGLGKEVLRLLAEESRAMGAKGLVLTTAPTNAAALALYKGAGFVEDRFVPHFYGEKEDRFVMRWRFPEPAGGADTSTAAPGGAGLPPEAPAEACPGEGLRGSV
jgi:ribosomal protein S18 acetylase RimI-like enzyme